MQHTRLSSVGWTIALATAACLAGPLAVRASSLSVASPFREAYILSFRSPDLVRPVPEDRWGQKDERFYWGRIATDFPVACASSSIAIIAL